MKDYKKSNENLKDQSHDYRVNNDRKSVSGRGGRLKWLIPVGSWREKMARRIFASFMEFRTIWRILTRRKRQTSVYIKKNRLKPKIGYVIPGTGISGGVAVICEHANRLFQRGYDILLISEDDQNSIPWFPNQLIPVIPLRKAKDEFCDILVATGWTTAYTLQTLDAERKFYFVQSDESRFYRSGSVQSKMALKTYGFDYEFITMAGWLKDWLKNEFGKDAVYVPNGLDENIMFPDTPLEKKMGKVRVLLEGSINIPYKGMLDAFAAVYGLDCEVWCVSSSGRPKPEWKCDRFFEKVPFGKMRHIYSSCDILLKMSRVESFAYPPLEMMACGGAVVVGEVTGIDEYVIDGYNALVVRQGDIQGAHDALKKLIENEKIRNELITNGKKTAENFRWDPSIDLLEGIFFKELAR
jgi:O-antigen biosynthesis protein